MAERKYSDNNSGFTLLEIVAALAMASMTAIFTMGFLHPQIRLYYDSDRRSQAKAMCAQAYMELEQVLRYGYVYRVDPIRQDEISYYVRKDNPGPEMVLEHGPVYEKLPPVANWPVISADDLDVEEREGMKLELDFKGTSNREARVVMRVRKDDVTVYEQEAVICSMYGYSVEGENSHER